MTVNYDYNPFLVGLSMLIASIASYVALDAARRIGSATGNDRRVWLLAGGAAMGFGIGSMHLVGMLSMISVPIAYDVLTLAASFIVGIAGSMVAFFMSALARARARELVVASLFMGLAISGMHYVGMASMRMAGALYYDPGLLAVSVLLPVVVSFVSLKMARPFLDGRSAYGRRLTSGSAAVMGSAVYGAYYTLMLAMRMDHGAAAIQSTRWSIVGNYSLAATVSVTTLMVLAIAVVGAIADRKIRAQTVEASELRRTTDLLRAVIEDSPEAIIVTDPNLRVSRWNSAATTLLGWEDREMIGEMFSIILPSEAPDQDTVLRDSALHNRHAKRAEAVFRRKDGSQVDVSVSVAALRPESRGFVFLVRDETVRKRLEDRVRQSQKMEAVGQLAGGIAHDFNNLLTAIIGHSDFLLADLADDDPRREDVMEIERAADRAVSLTTQLLAFSRQQMIQHVELALNEVIMDMMPMLRRLLPANIEIATSLGNDLWVVKADKGQLEQIVLNLMLNARDAMPDGGVLTVETANNWDDFHDATTECKIAGGHAVVLTVADTGCGMTPEVQARLFEPFFTTKAPGRGTGLGLATVHGIVAQNGGCINLESMPGKGTRFTVALPRVEAGGIQSDAAEAPRSNVAGSETILLVEDNDMVRAVAARILRANGYTVLEAENGNEAVASYGTHRGVIRLVITDMVMPGMGGYEVENALRDIDSGLRILFISGYSREALDRQDASVGTKDFLTKPFTSEALALKVREMMDRP